MWHLHMAPRSPCMSGEGCPSPVSSEVLEMGGVERRLKLGHPSIQHLSCPRQPIHISQGCPAAHRLTGGSKTGDTVHSLSSS